MELIDRYLNEVGRNLPPRNRDDILAELRSLLLDELDEQVEGKPSEEDIVALLKRHGSPKTVAASYSGGQYLIGPILYPLYIFILKIALMSAVVVFFVMLGLNWWSSLDLAAAIGKSLGFLYSMAIGMIGWITAIFALLQHLDVEPEIEKEMGKEVAEWNPRSLPAIQDKDRVSRFEIGFGLIVQWIVLSIMLSVRSDPFGGFLPVEMGEMFTTMAQTIITWLCVLTGIEMIIEAIVLIQGRWQIGTRLAKMGSDLAGIVVFLSMLSVYLGWMDGQNFNEIQNIIAQIGKGVLIIVPIVMGIDFMYAAYLILRSKTSRPVVIAPTQRKAAG